MKKLSLFIAIFVAFAQPTWAEYYEREGNYIYKVTKYTELWSTSEGIKLTTQVTHQVLTSMIDSLIQNKILPESIVNKKDLEAFRKTQDDIDHMVDYLNEFVEEQRARGGKLEGIDVVPDAFMVFAGHKFSFNLIGGVGGSVLLGSVVMPVKVQKIDIRTNQIVDEYPSLRASTIVWPTGDAGIAVGGGVRNRIGIGAVWDLNHAMVKPDQFYGVGGGVSWSPVVIGFGVNVKTGVIANWDMPGWVDFAYAAVSFEMGPAGELGLPRANATTILKASSLLGLLEKSSEDAYNKAMKDMNRKFDELIGNRKPKDDKDEKEEKQEKPGVEKPAEGRRP